MAERRRWRAVLYLAWASGRLGLIAKIRAAPVGLVWDGRSRQFLTSKADG
jgi:hypothetical protein